MSVIYLLRRSPCGSSILPSIVLLGRATLRRWFTWTCSPQMEQPADRPAAGGLLHHLLTLTLAGGYFLLPTPAVTNCFHFQKWGALCCPDFPLVPCPRRGIWHQRQAEALLSTDKSTKYCAKNKGKLVFLSNFYDYYNLHVITNLVSKVFAFTSS